MSRAARRPFSRNPAGVRGQRTGANDMRCRNQPVALLSGERVSPRSRAGFRQTPKNFVTESALPAHPFGIAAKRSQATITGPKTMTKQILIIASIVLLVAYLLTGVTMVRPGERTVVRRFGRVLPDKPGPGLLLGMPWGIDRIDRIEVDRVRTARVGYRFDSPDESPSPAGRTAYRRSQPHQHPGRAALQRQRRCRRGLPGASGTRRGTDRRLAESALAEWIAARTVDDVILNAKLTLPGWIVRTIRRNGFRVMGLASRFAMRLVSLIFSRPSRCTSPSTR